MSKFNNANIAVIGAGITGQSCVRYLHSLGAVVSVFDTREESLSSLNVRWGEIPINALVNFDLVVVSPGVSLQTPAIAKALAQGVAVIGDVELFARQNQTPTIGVTGSNGKSTVVSLLGEIFSKAGFNACVSGNIGKPVLNTVELTDIDWYVLELSSFQLESTYSLKLHTACILNISEDHLDRHGSMAAYAAAKQRIFDHADSKVTCRDDALTTVSKDLNLTFGLGPSEEGMSWQAENQTITYNGSAFINFADCKLTGLHNVLNIQAASIIALQAGIEPNAIISAVKSFEGLPHRYQSLRTKDSVHWINDSKATNPGATKVSLKAAKSDTQGKLILIAGGDAKQADLGELAESISDSVNYLIALGKDGRLFMPFAQGSVYVDSLEQAVTVAKHIAKPGDTVLLSPACASLDMFKNFEHRGECFSAAVEERVA